MKLDQLRKIIREEVKSAVKEELQDVMNEAVKHASTPQAQEFNEHTLVKPKDLSKTWTTNKPSTLDEMLNVTRAEMTTADANNIMGTTGVQKPNFASMMTNQMSRDNNGPMPGIDISSLDFVGKAKAIYDKSLEKSKASI